MSEQYHMPTLSVLDTAPIAQGGTAGQALHDVVALARTADECGYHRFWVAEHHASTGSAGSTPTVLMAHLAAVTTRLRIGSGGVMLTNHLPFVVAEQFATLMALHGDRIDLGVGRSSGGNPGPLESALRRDQRTATEFPALVDELLGFLRGEWPPDHPYRSVVVSPAIPAPPGVFVLGASENGARVAAERGLPFVYGNHLGTAKARRSSLDYYRSTFVAGASGAEPVVLASANVLCAEDDATAERRALDVTTSELARRDDAEGKPHPSPARQRWLAGQALDEAQVLHGAPETVIGKIRAMAGSFGATEMLLVPYDATGADRRDTLRLLAPWTGRPDQAVRESSRPAGAEPGAGRGARHAVMPPIRVARPAGHRAAR